MEELGEKRREFKIEEKVCVSNCRFNINISKLVWLDLMMLCGYGKRWIWKDKNISYIRFLCYIKEFGYFICN